MPETRSTEDKSYDQAFLERLIEAAKQDSPPVILEKTLPDLASGFVQRVDPGNPTEDHGMIAYMLLSYYSDKIPKELTVKLQDVLNAAEKKHPQFNLLTTSLQVMRQEVQGYFEHQSYPFDYFQPAVFSSPLAIAIIGLECHRLASLHKKQFQAEGKRSMVVEPYLNPKTNQPGIWMSIKGIHFNPDKL